MWFLQKHEHGYIYGKGGKKGEMPMIIYLLPTITPLLQNPLFSYPESWPNPNLTQLGMYIQKSLLIQKSEIFRRPMLSSISGMSFILQFSGYMVKNGKLFCHDSIFKRGSARFHVRVLLWNSMFARSNTIYRYILYYITWCTMYM